MFLFFFYLLFSRTIPIDEDIGPSALCRDCCFFSHNISLPLPAQIDSPSGNDVKVKKLVLHISFHDGTKNDFLSVSERLGIRGVVTVPIDPLTGLQIQFSVTKQIGETYWSFHKNYLESFDAIVISDTTPLCRLILEGDRYKKPIIILVSNRFDFGLEENQEYLDLIKNATTMPNVYFVINNPYESYYVMKRYGFSFPSCLIRPTGLLSSFYADLIDHTPASVVKNETFFMTRYDKEFVKKVTKLGIPVWSPSEVEYGGPRVIAEFKAVIHIPYQVATMGMWENLGMGVIYFIPTPEFRRILREDNYNSRYMDWYVEENKELFIYFSSWNELGRLIRSTNYDDHKLLVRHWMSKHTEKTLNQWKKLYCGCRVLDCSEQ